MIVFKETDASRADLRIGATFQTEAHGGGRVFKIIPRPVDAWNDDTFCKFCAFGRETPPYENGYANTLGCARVVCDPERRADGRPVVVVDAGKQEIYNDGIL